MEMENESEKIRQEQRHLSVRAVSSYVPLR